MLFAPPLHVAGRLGRPLKLTTEFFTSAPSPPPFSTHLRGTSAPRAVPAGLADGRTLCVPESLECSSSLPLPLPICPLVLSGHHGCSLLHSRTREAQQQETKPPCCRTHPARCTTNVFSRRSENLLEVSSAASRNSKDPKNKFATDRSRSIEDCEPPFPPLQTHSRFTIRSFARDRDAIHGNQAARNQ